MNAGEQLIEQGREQGLQVGREQGRAQGRADGLRTAISAVMFARQLPLSESGRSRMASCSDVPTLTAWLQRAATASAEAEIFA